MWAANLFGVGTAAALFCNAYLGFFGLPGLLVPIFFIMGSLGMIQPNALAGAMSSDPHRSGTISALFALVQGAAGASGAALSAGYDGTAHSLAWVVLIGFAGALGAPVLLTGGRNR